MCAAQTLHPVLAGSDPAFSGELVGDEPVAEGRIVGVDLASGMDEVSVGPVPPRDGRTVTLVHRASGRLSVTALLAL